MTSPGWYLYGITVAGSLPPVFATGDVEPAIDQRVASVELLEYSGVAAVVRQVLLEDFKPAAMNERLRDDTELESMVRRHNAVVEAIHARQAILPSKFGVVYTHPEEIRSALRASHVQLAQQLDRLQGCDEWAVHLYADEDLARKEFTETQPAIRRLRDEMAVARPGRAYFLAQQLRDELRAATEQALLTLAERAFDRLSPCAVETLVNPLNAAAEQSDEVEILRASFLVARNAAERFESEVLLLSNINVGLRCELTGPWAPYSFAAQEAREAR